MAWALLYLHGVGDAVRNDSWYTALKGSLEAHGIEVPPLTSSRIIAPDYVELLKFPPADGGSAPTRTAKDSSPKEEALERRALYAREQARSIASLTGTVDSRGLRNLAGHLDMARIPLPKDLRDSRHYLRDEALRSAVMHRVLGSLGGHRDLVVVGHSLGSVVAIDLLRHLPPTVRIRRLVTIGSPAGVPGMWKSRPFQRDDFPFHQVDGWVNVLNPFDVITRGMGVNHLFSAAADARISLGASHSATQYLAHPVLGQLLAEPLQPPVTRVSSRREIELALTSHEQDVLDALAFAHMVRTHVPLKEKEKAVRVDLALRALRESTGRRLRTARLERGEPVPALLDALDAGEEPELRISHRSLEEQLFFAVLMATTNPLAPYEIELDAEHLAAVESLWLRHGFTRPEAKRVTTAVREAAVELCGKSWHRALLGGTLLGDTLLGQRAATLLGDDAPAFLTPSTPLPEVRSQVLRVTAFAEAHRSLDLPGDRTAGWVRLNAWASELSARLNTVELISDSGAAGVKELRAKVQLATKAAEWLAARGLLPAEPEPEPVDEETVQGELA